MKRAAPGTALFLEGSELLRDNAGAIRFLVKNSTSSIITGNYPRSNLVNLRVSFRPPAFFPAQVQPEP